MSWFGMISEDLSSILVSQQSECHQVHLNLMRLVLINVDSFDDSSEEVELWSSVSDGNWILSRNVVSLTERSGDSVPGAL